MKKKNKIISLTLSTFLLFSAFGSAMFVNAEGENLDTNEEITEQIDDVKNDELLDEEIPEQTDDEEKKETDSLETDSSEVELNQKSDTTQQKNKTNKENDVNPLAEDDEQPSEVTLGNFKIKGGVQGTDFALEGASLIIKTATPLTIQNVNPSTFNTNNIRIQQGITANITLAGVSIQNTASNDSPFNIMGSGTTCNIILAKDTVNTLNATSLYAAALHCGEGSTVTIDGSGTLNAYGGHGSAGIGSGFNETAGHLIINGGTINAHAWRYNTTGNVAPADSVPTGFGPSNWDRTDHIYSGGAGIGAGTYGGASTITINGGTIHAYGSAHGAGIGASYAHNTAGTKQTGASTNTRPLVCGDITINGGYITSKGYSHGAAFGGSCGTTANGCTIRVTGGTLLPTSLHTNPDFNANGTGKVYITGGSIRTAGGNKFMNGSTPGVAFDKDGKPVFMVTINLSAEGIKNDAISDWSVTIGGEKYEYGAPSYFDDGKLYLWVPQATQGKTISVSCKYNGKPLEPLYIEDTKGDGTAVLKRYVDFDLPDDFINNLTKHYDGLSFDTYDFEKTENAIEAVDQAGNKKVLNKNDNVEVVLQRYDAIDGNPIGEEYQTGGYKMPADAGIYRIQIISRQYANEEGFRDSYWGHRARGWAVINPADSRVVDVDYHWDYKNGISDPTSTADFANIVLKANVMPNNIENVEKGMIKEALTCEAPTGTVQFYINGVRVGKPVKLTAPSSGSSSSDLVTDEAENSGYKYASASLTMDYTSKNYLVPANDEGKFIVTAKYLGDDNYKVSEAGAKKKEVPEEFPFTTVPGSVVTPQDTTELDKDKDVPVLDKLEPSYDIVGEDDDQRLVAYYKDMITRNIVKTEDGEDKPVTILDKVALANMLNQRYALTNPSGRPQTNGTGEDEVIVKFEPENIVITDKDGNEVDEIDLSKPENYTIQATHNQDDVFEDTAVHTSAVLTIDYKLIDMKEEVKKDTPVDVDTDGDGYPDVNVDPDGDGKPEINIDPDGDGKPDVNVDTDDDGKPDVNIDTDKDGKPDINIDPDGDGKPDINIVDKDGDGKPDDLDEKWPNIGDIKPDINIDTDDDGKPDVNVDTDDDGKPDVNIDTDGDNKPDINIDPDGNGKPDINIVDKDGDGKPDDLDEKWPNIGDVKPDINIDTDDDGKPDVNVDTDDDGKPDVNIDTDKDGKPDINIDPDGDGKPDINIVDKDGDGKPDDLDEKWPNIGDIKPDINIDTDDDGKPDVNVDTDDDGKPDVNIDTDGDNKPDINIDPDGNGKPDINIVDKDGDGKPDDLDEKWPNIGDVKPDINIDTDDDGKPDVNVDTDDDGKPDVNIDTDKDGKPDINIDPDGDGKADINIDTDGDGKADLNIDTDGDGKADLNIDKDGDGKPDLNIDTDGDGIADKNIDKDGDGEVDIDIQGEDIKNEKKVKTGDNTSIAGFAVLTLTSLFMVVLLFSLKKKENE